VRHALAGILALTLALAPGSARAAQIGAQLDRDHIAAGESVLLVVTVEGARQIEEPRFDLPDGLVLQGSDRAQSFSWVNGKSSNQIQFRYRIGATRPGRFTIGPILIKTDGQEQRSGAVTLEVAVGGGGAPAGGGVGSAGAPDRTRGGRPPAALMVLVEPRDPYVGQPVMLRARLIQRAPFAEDPQYAPPATTGFWADTPGPPESFYSDEPGGRVLVTETRTRMFPLGAGNATIGEATAQVVFATTDPSDPLGWINGGRREYTLQSDPVTIHVRPLPAGAPASYGGAVGSFETSWTSDRGHTARDVPFTVRLSVRGRGNLPLIQVPEFSASDLEVFSQTTDDSLGPAGSSGPGRKSFVWTVLPRREGGMDVAAPEFSWFDPADSRYHVLRPPTFRVEIGPPVNAGSGATPGGYPAELVEYPVHAGRPVYRPWAWGLGGALIGLGLAFARVRPRVAPESPQSTRAAASLRAVGSTRGAEFWRAAEDALDVLAAGGVTVPEAAAVVRGARYGGVTAEPGPVRSALVTRLRAMQPHAASSFLPRFVAMIAIVIGVVSVPALGWRVPAGGSAADLRTAETAARRGEITRARDLWSGAWQAGVHDPALAARLVWVDLQLGDVGRATAWALRGRRVGPRDPALEWVAARAREAGGLIGAPMERWPVRRIEWAVGSLVLAIGAGLAWPRRVPAVVLALLAVALGAAPELETLAIARRPLAVVTKSCALGTGGLELQPGQVLRLGANGVGGVQVRAGEEQGLVPADAIEPVRLGPGRVS
jgi:hypothetical protein